MKKLHISPGLALPLDTQTSTIVVYGGKGMGKTNFGSVLIEELTKTNLKWCYLDPLGVTWGLRHSADGKDVGVEAVILGGTHSDIPLEPTGGAVAADLVVDEPGNVIIDFSRKSNGEMWSIGEKVGFITAYAKRLFQRQGGLLNGHRREPLMQILDEAARYIPQTIPHGNPELSACLSAWETLTEEGRNVGIGVCFLTQRSARMAKSVSEVADAMFSFRIIGPNSISAVTDWLGEHVDRKLVHQYVATLRTLERGRCLIVSPGWLKFEGVITIRPRETFDSSATPKPGERPARVTGEAAKPDLAKYIERMKETILRVESTDPKKLQARIRVLEAQIAKGDMRKEGGDKARVLPDVQAIARAQAAAVRPFRLLLEEAMKVIVKVTAHGFEDAAIKPEEITKVLEATAREISRVAKIQIGKRNEEFERLQGEARRVMAKLEKVMENEQMNVTVDVQHNQPFTVRPVTVKPSTRRSVGGAAPTGAGSLDPNDQRLPVGEVKVLKAIAQNPEGMEERTQITLLTGYKRSSRDAYISRLIAKDMVGIEGGVLKATQRGIDTLGSDYEPLPSPGPELRDYWLNRLPEGERRVLEVLLSAGGKSVPRETIDEATGYKRSSRDAYLSRLVSRHAVESVGHGEVRASPSLF